ncbi:MAG TPA: GNAT family N-acetyltransferase [Actinomycetes bacterium]|nr:GNAT family N-acetyltransferase [Actinomycetes bacterium]
MDTPTYTVTVRAARPDDAEYVRSVLIASWDSTKVVARGELIDAAECPTLIAEADGTPAGVLTYRIDDRGIEVVSIDSQLSRAGVGTALLAAAAEIGRKAGAARLWLVTSNDNTAALRFYQRRGLDLVALRRNAWAAARRLKPQIPELGMHGIPIRHELELELPLTPSVDH